MQIPARMGSLYAIIVLLLLVVGGGAESASRNDCNAGDTAALVAVKAAFNNASYFASWTPATKCCHWRGIKCEYFPTTGNVNVIGLDIVEDDSVAGPIPGDAIAGLTNLVDLTLYKVPGVYGPIPKELSRISGLFALTVSGTGMSGPVPSYLGALTALQFLDLSSNRLTGHIPPSLAAQPHITSIVLSGNRLDGRIPVEVLNLDGLQFFNVSNNRLCGMVPSGSTARFGDSAFQHNKCLCGDAGLPPCHTN
uniref:Uncharacterized protein n=1 Tax=Avena sativa TaxID=4498 RepID=A0ACD5XCM2_AVESA